jgi:hypothetical protein
MKRKRSIKMRRSILVVGGLAVLVLLLGSAAFVGSQLLGGPDLSGEDQDVIVSGSGDVRSSSGILLDVEPAGDMPDAPADVAGLFLRREDNSLFVGTGNMSGVLVDGKWELSHDGPAVEVVATRDTLIYRDDTLQQIGNDLPSEPLQQVLKPGSVDEIGRNCTIQAWGERRGERVAAEVLVFQTTP